MDSRDLAKQIFVACVESVRPEILIPRLMKIKNDQLYIGTKIFSLKLIDKIFVIGAGKASALMASAVEKILGDRISGGHVVTKYGQSCKLNYINLTEAGHPVPDSKGYEATKAILEMARKADINDLVICLISGGGSALLADFPEGSSPEEMRLLNNMLINSGASVSEINTVRKHLSNVKGGQLAKAVSPGTIVSLILSDVIGDPLDAIASGPTTHDPTTFLGAIDVLLKFDLLKSVPSGLLRYLREGEKGRRPETPKEGDPVFDKTFNLLIGTNRVALEAGMKKAWELEITPYIIDDKLQGDVNIVAKYLVKTSLKFKSDKGLNKPLCLLFGGEPTVKMAGNGLGGRNQHLALLCGLLLQEHPGVTILIAGTDGTDGPTDAAGAIVNSETILSSVSKGRDPGKFLDNFDSYNFFKAGEGHIITGPTNTNVMDIVVAIVQ